MFRLRVYRCGVGETVQMALYYLVLLPAYTTHEEDTDA